MSVVYNHKQIETKWRDIWKDNPVNKDEEGKEKYYCLDMFPYPSGSGLHVGHWRGYVLSDVWSRYKVLQGYYVLHPMDGMHLVFQLRIMPLRWGFIQQKLQLQMCKISSGS